MPNFSSLACQEVAEKFVWGGGGGFARSFLCKTQPLCCVEVRVRVGVLTICFNYFFSRCQLVFK